MPSRNAPNGLPISELVTELLNEYDPMRLLAKTLVYSPVRWRKSPPTFKVCRPFVQVRLSSACAVLVLEMDVVPPVVPVKPVIEKLGAAAPGGGGSQNRHEEGLASPSTLAANVSTG